MMTFKYAIATDFLRRNRKQIIQLQNFLFAKLYELVMQHNASYFLISLISINYGPYQFKSSLMIIDDPRKLNFLSF
jgi:hypothetical protein